MNGGREGRPIGAYELAKAVEELGAGEILLNCIDCDGESNSCSFYKIPTVLWFWASNHYLSAFFLYWYLQDIYVMPIPIFIEQILVL